MIATRASAEYRRVHATIEQIPPARSVTERRGRTRYPVRMTVRFRGLGKCSRLYSVGCTADLSAAGLFVLTDAKHGLGLQAKLEMSMDWPVHLNGKIPLQLVAHGRLVRLGAVGFAVSLDRHEFRTMRRSSDAAPRELSAILPGFAPRGERRVAIPA